MPANPCLLLKNTETGVTSGVTAENYRQLIEKAEYEDAGSTALFEDMPLPPDFPKREELREAGLLTVGDVTKAEEEAGSISKVDGIGKRSAKKILKVIERGHLDLDEPEEEEESGADGKSDEE